MEAAYGNVKKKCRKAFVVEPGFDMSALRSHADTIEYIFSGFESAEQMMGVATDRLSNFNPHTDILVPVGRVTACMIAGKVLSELHPGPVTIAVYADKKYSFEVV